MSYWPRNTSSKVKPLLFIHIPKTAGLSVQMWYRATYGKFEKAMHAGADHPLIRAKSLEMNTFAVVRNPFDLVYSWYRYKRKMLDETRHRDPQELAVWHQGFNPWMEKYYNKVNHTQDKSSAERDFNPISPSFSCSHYVGNLVDFVVRFEHLEQDWRMVQRSSGSDVSLGYTNRTVVNNQDYRKVYNAHSRSLVEQSHAQDFNTWNYDW